jgi:hypothetical protein
MHQKSTIRWKTYQPACTHYSTPLPILSDRQNRLRVSTVVERYRCIRSNTLPELERVSACTSRYCATYRGHRITCALWCSWSELPGSAYNRLPAKHNTRRDNLLSSAPCAGALLISLMPTVERKTTSKRLHIWRCIFGARGNGDPAKHVLAAACDCQGREERC